MKGFLILFALCFLGTHALPKPVIGRERLQGRVGGGAVSELAPHACMVLVHRQSLDGTNTAALGGGSIISARHVLTAAHLVQGTNLRYQIGFIVGSSRRLVEATFRLMHEEYDNTDFSNDIALIFLQGTTTFPLASAIPITPDEAIPGTGGTYVLVGFGFTAADSTGASANPYAATQAIAATCEFENFNLTDTHFCATDEGGSTWVCPGDNGAGLFLEGTTDATENRLIGVASRILTGCAAPQLTGYTACGPYIPWITNITGIPVPTIVAMYSKLHQL